MKTQRLNDADSCNEGAFQDLPDELIVRVFSFLDIPGLGTVSQSHKEGRLFLCASCDDIWKKLVYRRFRINVDNTRCTSHGGKNWKDAYRSMSFAGRTPRCRYTSPRKVAFAKSGGGSHKRDPVLVWVFIAHTENCATRPSCSGNRSVELRVCIQNVTTTTAMVVDSSKSTLHLYGENIAVEPEKWPRILFPSSNDDCVSLVMVDGNYHTLGPLGFVILTMRFPCGSDLFETDFLARALILQVPVHVNEKDGASVSIQANFLPESYVWQHYMELPGGCLTLNDKSSLVNS